MQRITLLTLTLGAILFVAHPVHAQFIGDRMRITTENGEELIGQMKRYNSHSMTILIDSIQQSIAYADMARVQRSLGFHSYSRQGAVTGLGVGVLYSRSVGQGLVAGFWGGLGGLTGMLVGATIKRERWKPLDIPGQGTASVIPTIGVHPNGLWVFGDRMRITTENGEKLIGRMKSFDNSFLTILADSTELSIAYADMALLQRSLGTRRHFIKGALIGAGAGTVAGVLAASTIECTNEACVGAAIGAALSVIALSGGGTLLGLIVGAAIRTEKWERLEIPGQSAASVMPTIGVHPGGRLALGARISF